MIFEDHKAKHITAYLNGTSEVKRKVSFRYGDFSRLGVNQAFNRAFQPLLNYQDTVVSEQLRPAEKPWDIYFWKAISKVKIIRQRVLGKVFVVFGCVWLFLILFHIVAPLFLLLFFLGVWLKASNGFAEMLTVVSGYEYVAALATVASGLTVWRRNATGRWPLKMIFVLFALFIFGMGTRFGIEKRAAQKREAAYQLALSEYQQVLKPGMTRKEVEIYLRSKMVNFQHTCCIESSETAKRHSWDDLVAIGQEDHPWFCGEHNVYIAFQFIDYKQETTVYSMEDDDLDSLRSISIHHSLERCL